MDPISHALFAKTLHNLDETGRLGRGAGVAFVLGGLLPDIDILRVTQGFDVYLVHHEAGTHTLAAAPFQGAILALLLRCSVRDARWVPLFIASTLGVVAHLFLDFTGGSDMRLLTPFSDVRAGWHLMAMWEPAVVLGLLALHLPRFVRRRRMAVVFLALFSVFLVVKHVSQRVAVAAYHRAIPEAEAELVRVEQVRGSLLDWLLFDRTEERYRVFRARAGSGGPRLQFSRAVADPADELAQSSLAYPVVRNLLRIGELPLVWVEGRDGSSTVYWSDMQFCGAETCAIRFGVELDPSGNATLQLIAIAGVRQTRPAALHETPALSSIE